MLLISVLSFHFEEFFVAFIVRWGVQMNSLSLSVFAGLCLLLFLEDKLPGKAFLTGRFFFHWVVYITLLSHILKVSAEKMTMAETN